MLIFFLEIFFLCFNQTENWRVGLLMKAITISGSRKTLSQMIIQIERYSAILREMSESEDAQKVRLSMDLYLIFV